MSVLQQVNPTLDTIDAVDLAPVHAAITEGRLKHVAMIMDGNRRWAKANNKPPAQGHYEGFLAFKNLLTYCIDELHLPVMTVYAFSTENWRRESWEVQFLLKFLGFALKRELKTMKTKNVQFRVLGDITAFPDELRKVCEKSLAETKDNTGLILQVAINYGGRAEMLRTVQQIASQVKAGALNPEDITEELVSSTLYSGSAPDPDLIIRTGGEQRLSNFLLWQGAYAEISFRNEYWPEFTPTRLNETLLDFVNRNRRMGR